MAGRGEFDYKEMAFHTTGPLGTNVGFLFFFLKKDQKIASSAVSPLNGSGKAIGGHAVL